MALTGTEVSQYSQPVVQDELVDSIQGSSLLIQYLNAPGNYEEVGSLKYRFWRRAGENTDGGYRKLNSPFAEQINKLDSVDKYLTIRGERLDVDKVLYLSMGEKGNAYVSQQIALKLGDMGMKLTRSLIKGDANANPGEINGLNKELAIGNDYFNVTDKELYSGTANYKAVAFGVNWAAAGVQMSSAANRALLSDAIDIGIARMLAKPDVIVCGAGVRRVLKKIMYETGAMTAPLVQFGQNVSTYDDIPIIQLPKNFDRSEILDFNELSPDGTSNNDCASLYLIKFGSAQNYGALRKGTVNISEPKLLDDGVTLRWTMEYLFNHVLKEYDSVIRIGGIRP